MRRRYVLLIAFVGIVVFLFLLGKLPWHEAISVLTSASVWEVLAYLGVSLLIRWLIAVRWKIVLDAKKIVVPLRHIFGYRSASFAVSFITPGPRVGGEAVAAGLVRRHKQRGKKVSYAKSLSTIVIDRAVELQTFATLFFLGVLGLAILGDIDGTVRAVLLSISVVLLSIIGLMTINVVSGKPFLTRTLLKFTKNKFIRSEVKNFEQTIVSFYREDRIDFIKCHIVSSLAWLASLLEYYFLLKILGITPTLGAIFIIYSFVGIAYLIPIPLAIGSLEGSQALAFTLLSFAPALGVVLALLTRLRDILLTIFGFMVLLYYGIVPSKATATIR